MRRAAKQITNSKTAHGNPFLVWMLLIPVALCCNDLFAQCVQQKLIEEGGGEGVAAISGPLAIVSTTSVNAPGATPGAAAIFRFDGTNWNVEAEQIGPSGIAREVAIHGDVAAVRMAGLRDFVLVYREQGGMWSEEARLELASIVYGRSALAVRGNVLVVRDYSDSISKLLVFEYDGANWNKTQEILDPTPDPYGGFGVSISLQTHRLFAGDREQDTTYMYRYDGAQWILEQELVPHDAPVDRGVGSSVSLSSPWAAIGARWDDEALNSSGGAVYLFFYDGIEWIESTKISPDDLEKELGFGYSVSLDGDTLLVGALKNDDEMEPRESGSAYVYRLRDGHWRQHYEFEPFDAAPFDWFGHSVALDGTLAVVVNIDGASYGVDLSPVDCNLNGIEDGEEFSLGLAEDCTRNCLLDECDLELGTSFDCNFDDIPDECQDDCNGNGLHDTCDLGAGTSQDCQRNGIPDECDVTRTSFQSETFTIDLNRNRIPDECEPPPCESLECGGEACISLEAVAVNGAGIESTNCVQAKPGDVVECEFRLSGWGPVIGTLQGYRAILLLTPAAKSGTSGVVLPLGWDAALGQPDLCASSEECEDGRACLSEQCVGPDHHPQHGAFIDQGRSDFVFGEHLSFFSDVTTTILDYIFQSALSFREASSDTGAAKYGGTLRLGVSEDACGDFVVLFRASGGGTPPDTWFYNPTYGRVSPARRVPLIIQTPNCDCNGNGVPDPIDIEAGDESDCNGNFVPDSCELATCGEDRACQDCNGNGVPDGCDIAQGASQDENNDGRPDECFPIIPTVSTWGLVVLMLSLLVTAKVRRRED